MEKVYVLGAKRTPIGSFLGSLKNHSASELGSIAIKAALEESAVPVDEIDEVIVGNALPAGQGQGVARQAAMKASLPQSTPAYGVNMVCGSGLKAVTNGFVSIRAGEAKSVVAAGTESMSQTPYLIPNRTRQGIKMGNFEVIDSLVYDGLTDAFNQYHMGVTAENVAEKYSISREEQDLFSFESQERAIEAIDNGWLKEEIVPVEVKEKRESRWMAEDDYPNRTTSLEKMGKLRTAF